jgi:hypothetical protein
MKSRELRFDVVKSKINWGSYFRDLMKPRFGGGFDSYSGRGPSVVAQNSTGEKRVMAVTKKMDDAKERAEAIERDFNALDLDAWCKRYDVPQSFVLGTE